MRVVASPSRARESVKPAALPQPSALAGTDSSSAEALLRLFEVSPELLGTASPDGYFTLLNASWQRVLGWTLEEMMAEPFVSFVHPDDVAATNAQAAKLAHGDGVEVADFENRYRTRAGSYRWFKWVVTSTDGVLYFIASDVTERRAADAERSQEASMTKAIIQSVADGLYVSDADGLLTFINPAGVELLGYDTADELLGRSSHAVFHHTHADGTPYPAKDCPLLEVRAAGETLHCEEDGFWRKDGSALVVSYSSAPVELGDGTGSVVAFRDITERKSSELRVRRELEALSWVGRIRDALEEDRLVLFAQPIVDLSTGEPVHHELLVRMMTPNGEAIAPGAFLPVAEQHGLIQEIDRRVFELAMTYAATGNRIALNLSADSISEPALFAFVKERLEAHRIDPSLIVLEITETALIRNEGVAQVFIENARELGCSVALDDFGTGYGSFRYLKQLPVSQLKIDQEFVLDLDTEKSGVNRHVIQAIVALAQGMGHRTVAEGVETEATRQILTELDVDYAQGYYFARPRSADDVFNISNEKGLANVR